MKFPGRNWYSIDFHVHSPASHDYKGDKDVSASDFLDHFIESGVEIICLTDHSTAEWADKLRRASKKKPITVFPGFEVTINGIHFTAIFPEQTRTNRLHEILVGFGIGEDSRGKKETVCNQNTTAKSFSEAVHSADGLVIAAHSLSSKDGLMGHQKVLGISMFENFLPFIDIFEIKPSQEATRIEEYLTSIRGRYRGRKPPIIIGSDSHSPQEIVKPSCFVSLAVPTFRSLKQILIEPETRVSLHPVTPPQHPRIRRVYTTSQKLNGIDIEFSPHLNAIIGGRGSGKSATLDLLRWTLDSLPTHPATKDSIRSRITGFLGESFSATVEYIFDDKYFRAQRSGEDLPPVIEQWVSNQWVPSSHAEPFSVDFYSQGEASRLSDIGSESAQLDLIDNLGDTKGITESIKTILNMLSENATETSKLLDDLSEKHSIEQNLGKLRENQQKWTTILKSSAFQNRRNWSAANNWVATNINKIQNIDDNLINRIELPSSIPQDYPEQISLKELMKAFTSMEEAWTSAEQTLRTELESVIRKLPDLKSRWDSAYAEARANYEEELQRMQEADVANQDVLNSQLSATETEIASLESKLTKLASVDSELATLHEKRQLLLNTLEDSRKALFDERVRVAGEISTKLPSLSVNIEPAGNPSSLETFFQSLFIGSGIQNRDSVINALITSTTPRAVAKTIRDSDTLGLSQEFGITPSAAQKIKTILTPNVLLELETMSCDDVPMISLMKTSSGDHEPLKRLSAGQRCSAILAIALMDQERPLVIDQPEDELDHKFIVEEIVETIRQSKVNRQLIMATHNPNIPVLGDAELVVKVEEMDNVCHVEISGGLEECVVIERVQDLDGGRAAFERRRERYS